MKHLLSLVFVIGLPAAAQQMTVPNSLAAGTGLSITTSGSGEEEFLLFGPGTAIKRQVKLGSEVALSGEEVAKAGRYIAVLGPTVKTFWVKSAGPKKLSFIARPSRVPVARPDVVIGVAFVFDNGGNLVLSPAPVKFSLSVGDVSSLSRTFPSRNGIAWVRTASGSREGAAQFVASLGDTEVRRVVQQVAAEPCNIRMRMQRVGQMLELVTEPVRDCSGNMLPDGTIVTFSQAAPGRTRSTVDARMKRGIARATLPAISGSIITVASGVVLGNELRVSGGGD